MAASESLHQHDHKTVANLQALIKLQYPARRLPLTDYQMVNSLMVGRHRSRARGRGMDFEELRHYRVGDDIRQMDWKVTNRTRKPHVRIYSEERERPVILVVDQRAGMFFGSRRMMKSVVAAEMAALLAWHVVDRGDRVGMLVFNDQHSTEVRPANRQSQILQILNRLCDYGDKLKRSVTAEQRPALASLDDNGNRLNPMLAKVRKLVGHDALIHLVSDLEGANDETGQRLSQLMQHNNVVIDFIHDPLEQALPQQGNLALSDGRFQVELDAADQDLQQKYSRDFAARMNRIQSFLKTRNIPVLPLTTAQPLESQLFQMLGV
ncbi:MAG: DUF58 domain-containing protein [Candidatus Pelagadaptatus aseana]|uniref:DUF58 domain-containing protein n=1 Tax=Candidatus Pelagadaptatus aseana TaxID=3120508 RepID=UPI0039B2F866